MSMDGWMDGWVNKTWYVHTTENDSALRKEMKSPVKM